VSQKLIESCVFYQIGHNELLEDFDVKNVNRSPIFVPRNNMWVLDVLNKDKGDKSEYTYIKHFTEPFK